MTEKLRAAFEHSWPWLAAALQRYGNTHDKEHLWQMIESGDAQLFPLPHAAFATTQQVYPTGLRECCLWLAGGELSELRKVEPLTMKWAKSLGCQRATLRGRKAWGRALPDGWREVAVIFVKELT